MNQSIEQALAVNRDAITSDKEQEYFDLHQDRYRFILKHISELAHDRGARILDVGCYPPHLSTALQLLGFRVSGIASRHEPINAPSVVILNIEKDRLPFRNGSFDFILFSEVIEHLVVNPQAYLSEFRRVLTRQGRLFITTPNAAGLHKLIPILFGRSTYFPLEQLYATRHDDGSLYHRHNREFTMTEMKEILERAQFSVNTSAYVNVYKRRSSRQISGTETLVRRLARRIAYTITDVIPRFKDTLYLEASPQ